MFKMVVYFVLGRQEKKQQADLQKILNHTLPNHEFGDNQ